MNPTFAFYSHARINSAGMNQLFTYEFYVILFTRQNSSWMKLDNKFPLIGLSLMIGLGLLLDASAQTSGIVLNEKNDPTNNIVSDIKNTNMPNLQDFFAQLFEWFKNLFRFS